MVAKRTKRKKIPLVVYHNDLNSEEFLIEVLSQMLGYDVTQTANCVNIITTQGYYVVKTFDNDEVAEATLQLIIEQGIPAELIIL